MFRFNECYFSFVTGNFLWKILIQKKQNKLKISQENQNIHRNCVPTPKDLNFHVLLVNIYRKWRPTFRFFSCHLINFVTFWLNFSFTTKHIGWYVTDSWDKFTWEDATTVFDVHTITEKTSLLFRFLIQNRNTNPFWHQLYLIIVRCSYSNCCNY